MAVKKSIVQARAEALELSRKFPNNVYRVMDKKGKLAVCTGSDWVYRERVLSGWYTVAAYEAGVEREV